MSVLIKGMEMPKTCGDCPIGDTLCCSLMPGVPALWKEYTLALRTNRRHEECPLVPVPPHGDLIDQDEYRDEFMNGVYDLCSDDSDNYRANAIIDLFDEAPTIIPASEEREG